MIVFKKERSCHVCGSLFTHEITKADTTENVTQFSSCLTRAAHAHSRRGGMSRLSARHGCPCAGMCEGAVRSCCTLRQLHAVAPCGVVPSMGVGREGRGPVAHLEPQSGGGGGLPCSCAACYPVINFEGALSRTSRQRAFSRGDHPMRAKTPEGLLFRELFFRHQATLSELSKLS
jgi:hypothetical protein